MKLIALWCNAFVMKLKESGFSTLFRRSRINRTLARGSDEAQPLTANESITQQSVSNCTPYELPINEKKKKTLTFCFWIVPNQPTVRREITYSTLYMLYGTRMTHFWAAAPGTRKIVPNNQAAKKKISARTTKKKEKLFNFYHPTRCFWAYLRESIPKAVGYAYVFIPHCSIRTFADRVAFPHTGKCSCCAQTVPIQLRDERWESTAENQGSTNA